MYHVKEDKRSRVSAEMIYTGLMDCLKEKPLNELTVREIADRAGVGRATFYRNFDSPVDVLHRQCDRCFEEVLTGFLSEYRQGLQGHNDFLVYFFRYWMDRSALLEALAAANRTDIISECHLRHSDLITSEFAPEMDVRSEDYVYFISVRTGIMTSVLTAWVRTGRKKTPEELVSLMTGYLEDAVKGRILF